MRTHCQRMVETHTPYHRIMLYPISSCLNLLMMKQLQMTGRMLTGLFLLPLLQFKILPWKKMPNSRLKAALLSPTLYQMVTILLKDQQETCGLM